MKVFTRASFVDCQDGERCHGSPVYNFTFYEEKSKTRQNSGVRPGFGENL